LKQTPTRSTAAQPPNEGGFLFSKDIDVYINDVKKVSQATLKCRDFVIDDIKVFAV
jgi:hypothetical protein